MTFACQHPTESPIPESSAFRGQLAQSLSKRPVIWPLALVAEGRTIHAYQSAGVSLTQPVALHHHQPLLLRTPLEASCLVSPEDWGCYTFVHHSVLWLP